MATYTANYAMIKPSYADVADVAAINQNTDTIDEIMHGSQTSIADAYDPAETYAAGDLAMHDFQLYKCNTDDTTGTWDPTKWERTTAAAEGGGGGGSAVSITPTLSTGTKIADFEVDGVPGELYAPTGGGGGGGGNGNGKADLIYRAVDTSFVDIAFDISKYDLYIINASDSLSQSGETYTVTREALKYYMDNNITFCGWPYRSSSANALIQYLVTSNGFEADDHALDFVITSIYGINTGTILAPMIYSTEEREVGAWIDNKPLYQKTFNLMNQTLSDNTWNNNVLNTTGISIKSYKGYFSLGSVSIFPYEYYRNNSEFFTCVTNATNSDLNIRPNMNAGTPIYVGIVTLLYTKDADAPGSGSYGALGVPMEHYDGVERVVGTWQGETLYQKTFNVSNLSCTTSDYFGSYSGSLDLSGYIGNYDEVFVDLNMSYLINSGGGKERFILTQTIPNSTSINLFTCASCSNVSAILTVKYTKATT